MQDKQKYTQLTVEFLNENFPLTSFGGIWSQQDNVGFLIRFNAPITVHGQQIYETHGLAYNGTVGRYLPFSPIHFGIGLATLGYYPDTMFPNTENKPENTESIPMTATKTKTTE